MLHGSRLYGVATETSDYDYKGVYLNTLNGLLFSSESCDRSVQDDTDTVLFSLEHYGKLLSSGEVVSLEMLFAPIENTHILTKYWLDNFYEKRTELVNLTNVLPFVRYARKQISTYNNKPKKLELIDHILGQISKQTPPSFDELVAGLPQQCEIITDNHNVRYLKVANKLLGETTKYSLWKAPLVNARSIFGQRAKEACKMYDAKAYYHAYRICCEAIELVQTSHITFPRPEAPVLRQIRNYEFSQEYLEDEILKKFDLLDTLTKDVTPQPNTEKINAIVSLIYKDWLRIRHD